MTAVVTKPETGESVTRVRKRARADRPFAVRHFGLVLLGAILLVLVLGLVHISVGTVESTPENVLRVLTGQPVDKVVHTVVWDLRLPRALVAIAAGVMLALAGAILQAVMRNPLAEPDLTGASSGGVFLAVLYLSKDKLGWDFAPGGLELPFVAVVGSLLAGGLVYALSWQKGNNPVRLILTGVLVATILRAGTSLVLLVNQNAIGSIFLWMVGSLNARTWTQWGMLWPWALVTVPLGLACAGAANVMHLGDDSARSLGMRVEWARAGLLGAAVLLTAGAVSAVGALGFLGLIAPHLARRIVGEDARRVFPLAAAMGAALLLLADILSRAVIQPSELPVGAVMALIGAPFLMFLLRRGIRG